MAPKRLDDCLHLPNLSIAGFRAIKELSIAHLGRVTLLAGKNGVGKTTVLEAVRVYAAHGHYEVLADLLESRQEMAAAMVESSSREFVADFEALFHGRDVSRCARIAIGSEDTGQLRIEEASLSAEQTSHIDGILSRYIEKGFTQAFKVAWLGSEQILPWVLPIQGSAVASPVERYSDCAYLYLRNLLQKTELPPPIGCQLLGPSVLSNEEIARFWNTIALTDDEDRAVQALKLIFGNDLERVGVIRNDVSSAGHKKYMERVVAKLHGQARPVPLQSLGNGALHLAGVTLALIDSRDGFLLIDEAENGVHHAIQPDFWRMVFKTASANNVQVIATTHSFDCVRGFAQAAVECEEAEGVLVRLERKDEEMWAVEYSERNLKAVVKQHIGMEVR